MTARRDLQPACDALALAFAYPGPGWLESMRAAAAGLGPDAADTQERLGRFVDRLGPLAPEGREETFTRSFDFDPACALEVGWHLYGENYERGAFLVWLRARGRELGVETTTELPDHLTHVLQVLGRLQPEEAAPLAGATMLALDRILTRHTDEANPYLEALRAVRSLLEASGVAPEPCTAPAEGGTRDA